MQGGDEEEDALDAFMAGIQTEVSENKVDSKKPPKPEVEELDEYDAVADYMEAQQWRRSAGCLALHELLMIESAEPTHRLHY